MGVMCRRLVFCETACESLSLTWNLYGRLAHLTARHKMLAVVSRLLFPILVHLRGGM